MIMKETESLLIVTQNNTIRTNYTKIDNKIADVDYVVIGMKGSII